MKGAAAGRHWSRIKQEGFSLEELNIVYFNHCFYPDKGKSLGLMSPYGALLPPWRGWAPQVALQLVSPLSAGGYINKGSQQLG